MIENEAVLRQKLEYIHNNPVKRGYVELAEHWRYSSAGDYAGKPGLISVFSEWWLDVCVCVCGAARQSHISTKPMETR